MTISVEYMDHMGNDLSAVNAARVSFGKEKSDFDDSDAKLVRYLAHHRHMTPFRHNQVQVRCKAPIFLARQLGKHQAGLSWNEISRRYVDEQPQMYWPGDWRKRPDGGVKQGSAGIVEHDGAITEEVKHAYRVALNTYQWLLDQNVAPEMARMVLPQAMITEWVWSGNLLAFAHVYKERIDAHAQLEAQTFARKLDDVIRPLFPHTWQELVS